MADVVTPIVFPDYLISVGLAKRKIDILPWFEWDDITIPKQKYKLPELGHAGVLFFNGATGITKYYEYGRYDKANLGLVRKIRIPDVTIKEGRPTNDSLKKVLRSISKKAGQSTRIEAVYIEVENKYNEMLTYAELRRKQNSNPKRKPYDLTSYSCIHFVKSVVEAASIDTPWMIDPRPNAYIGRFRSDFLDLDYDPRKSSLSIEKN